LYFATILCFETKTVDDVAFALLIEIPDPYKFLQLVDPDRPAKEERVDV
jgi:hypothetical protein